MAPSGEVQTLLRCYGIAMVAQREANDSQKQPALPPGSMVRSH